MFEVLECSWSDFLAEVDAAADLDALIAAHETYLDTILKKSLLGERSQQLCKRLFTIFDTILRFKGFADRLYEIVRDIQVMEGRCFAEPLICPKSLVLNIGWE